jgi:hypothetical protein
MKLTLTNYELRLMIDQLSDLIISWHDNHDNDHDDDLVRLTVAISKLEDQLSKQQDIALKLYFQ